ncbi:MAG: hypothetical protein HY238_27925 [Acidobacteria bacterium]|nr:hypothetical protein [Acidobacteriota bacterium]
MGRSILIGLVGAVVLWAVMAGECAACQQLLRSSGSDGTCCTSTGKCKTAPAPAPAHRHCKTPANLSQQVVVVADVGLLAHLDAPLAPATGLSWAVPPSREPVPAARVGPQLHSPPDLFCLNSAFLI